MAMSSKTIISYDEDEQVLVELQASFVDTSKGAALKGAFKSPTADTTLVVTNKRIISTTGVAGKKSGCLACLCCCSSSNRAVRIFAPGQITEIGYRVTGKKSCCCGKSNFVISLHTSGVNSADFYLEGVDEHTVQNVLKLMYGVIN